MAPHKYKVRDLRPYRVRDLRPYIIRHLHPSHKRPHQAVPRASTHEKESR